MLAPLLTDSGDIGVLLMAHARKNMLPSKIEEMERNADQAHAKAYGNPEDVLKEPEPAPEVTEQQDVKEEPVKPLKAKNPEKENDPEYWKRRAELMAGKYDAEVPRFAEENRELKKRLEELERQMQAAPKPEATPNLDEDLVERYGEEFVRDMQRLLPTAQMPTTNNEMELIKAEMQRLREGQQDLSFERFKKDLDRHADGWQDLNTNEEFNLWLDGMDMASGMQRRQLFDTAVARADVERTAYFFNTFGQQTQSWEEQKPKSKVPPAEHYMAPQQSKAQQTPQGKKVWSSGEVAKFYDDVRRGRLDDAAAARIEQDIIAAQREGRYR